MDHVWHLLLLVAVYTTTLAVLTQNNLISSSFGIDTSSIWALSTTLALLLTFRAQRAAVRWWDSRAMWGKIIAINRMLASRLLSHHKQGLSDCTTTGPGATDDVAEFIINLVAFATATRNYLRKQRCDLNPDDFVGLLSSAEIANLDNSKHMVSTMVFTLRRSLDKLMPLRSPAPGWAGDFYTVTLHSKMSELIDELTLLAGGLERILNSPLPTGKPVTGVIDCSPLWLQRHARSERTRVSSRHTRVSLASWPDQNALVPAQGSERGSERVVSGTHAQSRASGEQRVKSATRAHSPQCVWHN